MGDDHCAISHIVLRWDTLYIWYFRRNNWGLYYRGPNMGQWQFLFQDTNPSYEPYTNMTDEHMQWVIEFFLEHE